ncbi:MAG: glycosyltransferase family 39 protein [Vicinamibacterales bacterium]
MAAGWIGSTRKIHASFTSRTRLLVSQNRWILFILSLAFILRLAWLFYAQPVPISDFNDYRTLAEGILDHGQFGYPEPTSFFLPVHPTLVAALMLVSRADLWLGFGMVVVSTASCLLIYLVARRVLARERPSLIAAAIFAFLPVFVLYSPVLATEHLFIVLMLLAMLAVVTLRGSTGWRELAVGLLLGLAILTRGEALFYAPAFLFYLWVGTATPRRIRLRQSMLIIIGIVVVLVPWYVRNAVVVTGETGLSASAGVNFYFAHNDSGFYGAYTEGSPLQGLSAVDASREGWRLAFEYLRENPLRLVKDTRRATQELFGDPDYALFLSTRDIRFRGDPDHFDKALRFTTSLGQALRLTATLLIAAAAFSLLLVPLWTRPLATLVLPLIVSSWALRTVIYWAIPRYGYFISVMLVLFSALTIDALIGVTRREVHAEV